MTGGSLIWRKSTFSGSGGSCVEVAQLADGNTLLRKANDPDADTVTFTPAEMKAFILGVRAGEFDDLGC